MFWSLKRPDWNWNPLNAEASQYLKNSLVTRIETNLHKPRSIKMDENEVSEEVWPDYLIFLFNVSTQSFLLYYFVFLLMPCFITLLYCIYFALQVYVLKVISVFWEKTALALTGTPWRHTDWNLDLGIVNILTYSKLAIVHNLLWYSLIIYVLLSLWFFCDILYFAIRKKCIESFIFKINILLT